MSKAVMFGMPAAVVDRALSAGVHPDCLRSRDISQAREACPECAEKTWAAIDSVYSYLGTPEERAAQMAADTAKEQAES